MIVNREKIDRIIRSYPKFTFVSGKVEEYRIQAAEHTLGLCFPTEYRDFLKRYGSVRFGNMEIYGILPDSPAQVPNGIWATKYLRETKNLPNNYLVIGFDGFGGYYCLDTAESQGFPVIVIDLNESVTKDTFIEKLADSFLEFLFIEMKEEAKSFKYQL